jgi:hypothetical protein
MGRELAWADIETTAASATRQTTIEMLATFLFIKNPFGAESPRLVLCICQSLLNLHSSLESDPESLLLVSLRSVSRLFSMSTFRKKRLSGWTSSLLVA